MFHLFNFEPRHKSTPQTQNKQEIMRSEESAKFLELLNSSDFNQAKIYLENNINNIDKDKIAGLYLENLLKDPEDEDFKNLYRFIESGIIDINDIKHNRFISMILTDTIQKLEKDKNFNAISRLENMDLV